MNTTLVKTLVAAAALATTSAYAASISFSDAASTAVPNWSDTLQVAQFDSSLGTLNSVTISFAGSNTGTLAAENLAATAGTMTLEGTATYTLSSAVWNFTGAAIASRTFAAGAFDGNINYAGTSGATFANATGSYSNNLSLTSGLSAFIGTGNLSFGVNTVGGSSYSGTGAAVAKFDQSADARVTVTYNYTAVSGVPEPESYAMLLAGLAAVGMVKRRRRD
jgi:hypothetical protein